MSLVWSQTYVEEEIRISIYCNCASYSDYWILLTEFAKLDLLSKVLNRA